MNERSLIALLTLPLVVAVTSLLGPGQSPPNAPTAIETKNEAPPAKEADFASRALKNACQVLSDYFALPVEPSSGEATGKVSFSIKETDFSLSASATKKAVERCNVEAVRDALRKENMGIDASFVFIPDPNASALALEADRALDAVRSALSSMGYVPYKASVLPWKSARTREKEAKTSDAKESGSSQPGIWLFRNQAAPRDLKLIFLVGDSPTAGISKPQFQQAVQQFRPLFRGVTKLRLVGPIYSGSVDSLGHAIRQLPPPGPGVPWAVFATSGTAEVPKLKDRLAKVVGSTAHIEFEQFAKLNALEDLLKSLRTMGRTAVLTESDTVFGLNHTEGADELFKYSRDLLSLRSAYAADKDLMSRIFPRSARWTEQLALHLSSPQDPTDAIPTYDPDNLAVSLQNTLRHLASNLHRRHFRNLIIIGSDNLDAIFLTRFFQEENPNLRIALLDSDTLLDRHAERVSTRGVITISQQPTGSVAMKHTEFPNGQAFGIYRACRRVLFNQEEKLKPNRIISVVGYDGEWPIQVLSPLPEGPKPAEVAKLFDIFHFHWIGPLMAFGLLLAWLALSPILVHSWSLRFRGNFGTTILKLIPFCRAIAVLPSPRFGHHREHEWDSEPARLAWLRCCFFTGGMALGLPVLLGVAAIFVPALTAEYPAVVARYFYFANGVSPLLPLTALLLAIHACAWSRVRACYLHSYTFRPAPHPLPIAGHGGSEIEQLINQVHGQVDTFFSRRWVLAMITGGVATVAAYDVWIRDIEIELGHPWSMYLWTSLFVTVGLLIVYAAGRFWFLWMSLHALLRRLEFHPLRLGFTTLPDRVSWTSIWSFSGARPTMVSLQMSSDYLSAIDPSRHRALTQNIDAFMESIHQGRFYSHRYSYRRLRLLQARIEGIAKNYINELSTSGTWNSQRIEGWKPDEPNPAKVKEKSTFPLHIKREIDGSQSVTQPAEDHSAHFKKLKAELIALQYAAFIRYAFMQLRNILGFMATATTLFFIALNVYPFQPIGTLTNFATFLFAIATVVVISAFYQMDRNPLLSRLSHTNAGKLDAGFGWRLIQFGALPTVTFLATHFPPIGQALVKITQIIPGLAKF